MAQILPGRECCGSGVVPRQAGKDRVLCMIQALQETKPQQKQCYFEIKLSPHYISAILDSCINLVKNAQAQAHSKHVNIHMISWNQQLEGGECPHNSQKVETTKGPKL